MTARSRAIADLMSGQDAIIVRVSDSEPAMLRYLTEQGIGIGDRVHLLSRQPFDGPCEVNIGDRRHNLGVTLARAIHVEHI